MMSRPEKTTRDFAKTLRSFHRLRRKIETGSRRKRKRVIVRVAGIVLASQVLLVLVPPFWYPTRGTVTSSFTIRSKPDTRRLFDLEFHDGLDIGAAEGARVVASALGRVVATGSSESAGNYVMVKHLFGFETFYAHLSQVSTRKGRLVHPFRRIGSVGSTGRATGPHLHFEIHLFARSLPPRILLLYQEIRRGIFGA